MNRLFLSASMALIAAGVQAQHADNVRTRTFNQLQPAQVTPAHPVVLTDHTQSQRDVVFSEDFANGLAGNNSFGAWSVSGTNGDIWRYTTGGPYGAFTDIDEIITSATAANGFMLFNSDSVNTDWSQTPPVIVAEPVALTGSLVSPVLDLSATPYVQVVFSQYMRYCCSDQFPGHLLEVSVDGGTSWTGSFPVDAQYPVNNDPTDPGTTIYTANIAGVIAGNAGNVRIRFTHDGATSGITHYHWQVDDVEISTLVPNEVRMDYGYTAQFGGGFEFGRVPQSQLLSTINVGAGIINNGGNPQTNVVVNVSLKDASNTEVASASIPLSSTLNSGDTMVADADMAIPSPLPTGLYTAHFTMTSDEIAQDGNPADNEQYRYFQVTDDLYSVDGIGVVPETILTTSEVGTNTFTDNTEDVRYLNYYEVHNTMIATGITIKLGPSSEAGSYFIAMLYDTADVLQSTDLTQPLAASDIHVITDADIAAGEAAVAFLDPYTLVPNGYFVSANLYREAESDLYILDDVTVPQPNVASMLWIPVDANNNFLYGGNGTAWAVRLSSSFTVGVQDAATLSGITIYPSPTNGPVEIRTETPGKMSVEVFNTLGELVQTSSFNGVASTLDLSGQAPGLYTIRVGDGTHYNVQRITLK